MPSANRLHPGTYRTLLVDSFLHQSRHRWLLSLSRSPARGAVSSSVIPLLLSARCSRAGVATFPPPPFRGGKGHSHNILTSIQELESRHRSAADARNRYQKPACSSSDGW